MTLYIYNFSILLHYRKKTMQLLLKDTLTSKIVPVCEMVRLFSICWEKIRHHLKWRTENAHVHIVFVFYIFDKVIVYLVWPTYILILLYTLFTVQATLYIYYRILGKLKQRSLKGNWNVCYVLLRYSVYYLAIHIHIHSFKIAIFQFINYCCFKKNTPAFILLWSF